jgi:hypothetical protein
MRYQGMTSRHEPPGTLELVGSSREGSRFWRGYSTGRAKPICLIHWLVSTCFPSHGLRVSSAERKRWQGPRAPDAGWEVGRLGSVQPFSERAWFRRIPIWATRAGGICTPGGGDWRRIGVVGGEAVRLATGTCWLTPALTPAPDGLLLRAACNYLPVVCRTRRSHAIAHAPGRGKVGHLLFACFR